MRHLALLSLLLALGCVHVHSAPVEQDGLEQLSCEDASAKAAAGLALTKINQDRQDGYIFALHRLSNAHMRTHGENGVVFYLSVDVAETNCSVLSRKDWKKDCEVRSDSDNPVYGQCKAAIYISKVNRVVRLYKYQCLVRPVPAARVGEICPDCPTHVDVEGKQVQKAVSLSLDKFNKESSFPNRFILLKVLSANSGMGGMGNMYYNAHYTIQETACPKTTEAGTDCPPMTCEFAHKGFCKGSLWQTPTGDDDASVECEIYEPEAADREKNMHILGGETDHSHNDTHMHDHDHDHAHTADSAHTHDHVHDHTKPHEDHTKTHEHSDTSDHHHTHDHAAGSGHSHAHAHSHDHGHGHDHVHAHHAKAHDHSGDTAGHHHDYKHADGDHTHHHDHELALDHDHKHAHLHEHEHHHHHDKHEHETAAHDHPEGEVKSIGAMGEPMMMPIFNDAPPMVGVTLIAKEDPQIPGEMEPVIESHFPKSISAQCAAPLLTGPTLVEKLLSEDTLFKGDPWA